MEGLVRSLWDLTWADWYGLGAKEVRLLFVSSLYATNITVRSMTESEEVRCLTGVHASACVTALIDRKTRSAVKRVVFGYLGLVEILAGSE